MSLLVNSSESDINLEIIRRTQLITDLLLLIPEVQALPRGENLLKRASALFEGKTCGDVIKRARQAADNGEISEDKMESFLALLCETERAHGIGTDHHENESTVDDTILVLRQRLISIMRDDFGEVSRRAFELKNKASASRGGDAMQEIACYMALDGLSFDEEGKFVWYGGREGFMPERPIGTPDDYLEIRDNFDALKGFVAKTLDKGRLHAGGGTHADTSRETNCAEYLIWLHRHNDNQPFRRNLEKAVFELLNQEFAREFVLLDVNTELLAIEKSYRPPHFTATDDINEALFRVGLNGDIVSERDGKFRDYFITEMEKTARSMTEDEYVRGFAGDEEAKRKDFAVGKAPKRNIVHFGETLPEFKIALRNWQIERRAQEEAVRKFSPQFNRLIGLLDVVASVGEKDSRFSEAYTLLRQKAEDKFMMDSPAIAHHYSETDIYRSILIALSAVQQGNELERFWLDNVANDPRPERVIASVHGLLTTTDDQKDRRKQISVLLIRLQQRENDLDQNYMHHSGIGFYSNENLLNDVLEHLAALCYSRDTFRHLDKEAGMLDFLQERRVNMGSYDFKFARFTPEGESELSASFDVADNSVTGETELEKAIRAYFNKNGYELPNDVSVTSLEGTRISGNETKIVEAGEISVDGLYEGYVGLNQTHFAFLYNAESGTVLLSEPTDSRSVIFGVRDSWVRRRKGLDSVEMKIPYAQFKDLKSAGEKVDAVVAGKRTQGWLGDSLYGLENRLSEEIAPYLNAVIRGRLVKNADGLV